jgi:histidine ammonia-lyase
MSRSPSPAESLELTGDNLTLADADRILRGEVRRLTLAQAARARVERARQTLTDLLARGETLYGVNTGFGKLAGQRI